jgi:hypothetical protein
MIIARGAGARSLWRARLFRCSVCRLWNALSVASVCVGVAGNLDIAGGRAHTSELWRCPSSTIYFLLWK